MAYYSPDRKEAILQKMEPPYRLTVAELASQEGSAARQPCTIGAKPPEKEVLFCHPTQPQRISGVARRSSVLFWRPPPCRRRNSVNIVASTVCTRNRSRPGRWPAWVPMPSQTNRKNATDNQPELRKNESRSSNSSYVTKKRPWRKPQRC